MTKYPMTKESRNPNDESMIDNDLQSSLLFGESEVVGRPYSSLGLRHSFVIGYFVIRH